jgi:hypothetical protein
LMVRFLFMGLSLFGWAESAEWVWGFCGGIM